jgi:hypothetical protein
MIYCQNGYLLNRSEYPKTKGALYFRLHNRFLRDVFQVNLKSLFIVEQDRIITDGETFVEKCISGKVVVYKKDLYYAAQVSTSRISPSIKDLFIELSMEVPGSFSDKALPTAISLNHMFGQGVYFENIGVWRREVETLPLSWNVWFSEDYAFASEFYENLLIKPKGLALVYNAESSLDYNKSWRD